MLLAYAGASAPAIARHLIDLFGIVTHTEDELVVRKRAESVALAQRPVSQGGPDLASLWYVGVQPALRQLHETGVDIALCTSNLRPITTAVLEAGGVDDILSKRIVQEDIGNERMKPDPWPYTCAVCPAHLQAHRVCARLGMHANVTRHIALTADCARQLGLVHGGDSSRTVAFEDSAAGARSAASAEIAQVLGVCNNCESDAEAVEVAQQLMDAGATGVFRTTVDAIDWLLKSQNSAAAKL
jgi:beta-phosphoglucomutase-like phosphatase (HAD superfamily)